MLKNVQFNQNYELTIKAFLSEFDVISLLNLNESLYALKMTSSSGLNNNTNRQQEQ